MDEETLAALSDEALETFSVELLSSAGGRAAASEEEFLRHYEHIRRVRRAQDSTHKRFTTRSKYSPERLIFHQRLLETFRREFASVPSEGKALFIGGMTGSGKTTLLRENSELLGEATYAETNPDSVKLRMIELGMAPNLPGLLPLEVDELIRYEAGILDGLVLDELIGQRKNVLIDRTMGSVKQMVILLEKLKAAGYDTREAIFLDIEPEVAYTRIKNRHRHGLDSFLKTGDGLGERPVPGQAIKASRPPEGSPFRSANAGYFYELASAGNFTGTPLIFRAETGEKISLEELKQQSPATV